VKSIEAIIRVEKVTEVKEALIKNGYTAMSFSTVIGRGEQQERTYDQALGTEVTYDLFARTYLFMLVDDNKVDDVITIIKKFARTGKAGDGLIFVRPIERVIRIRDE